MIDSIIVNQINQKSEEITSYVENLLDAQSYEDNVCYLMGFLSDIEQVLVMIANARPALSEKQILLEELIFDEWLLLYEKAKVVLTKRKYSDEIKQTINHLASEVFAYLKQFEKEIQKERYETECMEKEILDFFNHDNKCDFQQIADNLRKLLELEGVKVSDFKLSDYSRCDGLAVSFRQEFPLLQAPVEYRIQYNSIYGSSEDCFFAASIGVPG